jgi:hypothetical protein
LVGAVLEVDYVDEIQEVPWSPRFLNENGKAQMKLKHRYYGKAKSSSTDSSKAKAKGSKSMKMKKMMMMGKGKGNNEQPTPAPSPLPTIVLDDETYGQCILQMAASDIDRNDILDPQEYVRFVNRIEQEPFVGETFDDLDPLLQDNFYFLATSADGIDIFGSKPGQDLDDDQPLRRICVYTISVVQQVAMSRPTGPPASAPNVSFSDCFLSMVISDQDLNSALDQSEYVSFINRYFTDGTSFTDFDDLTPALQDNFSQAAGPNGSIDITGSRPTETPSDALLDFCTATQEAVDSVSASTMGG